MSSKPPIALWETERGMISTVDFSQDGEWIAIANYDGVIKVVDIQSGECLAQMKRTEEHNIYWHINFSPDCKWIATANFSGIVEVLDVHRGVCIAEMDRGEREVESADIYRLEFSPNGQYVAATADNLGTEGTQTYIWCPETGNLIFKFAGGNFSFSQDSCLLAGVTSDDPIGDADPINHYISVWNITTGERISHFSVKSAWMDTIIFSPCSNFLTSSSRDENLRVWDVTKGVQKMVYTDFQTSRTVPFYSTEGELFAIVDGQDTIEVRNMERNEKIEIPELHPRSVDARWFREFPQLALAEIHTDTTSNKKTQTSNIHTLSTLREPDCFPDPILFLPDGKTLAIRGHRTGIGLWDVESKQVRETLLKDARITSFTVLPSGNMLAAHSQDNNVKVWNAGKPDAPIAEFTETDPVRLIWNIAFAPTGDLLAVGSREGTIYLYDFIRKARLKPLIGHTEHIWSVCFSPDGKRLVSGSDDRIARLWDVESGEEIATLPIGEPHTLMDIAFSPCGNLIAGGLSELRLWCAETLTTLFAIPHPERRAPYALAFSPCGKYLASGTWWETGMEKMAIRLWDVASGENIATFWGHPTDIQSLAFSPDGTLLATGSFECTTLLWDLKPYIGS
jgi:WD40 repeat protein